MTELLKNGIAFLQKRYPQAPVLSNTSFFKNPQDNTQFTVYPMIAQDWQSGIKQRALAVENLGSKNEVLSLALNL